VKTGEYSGSDTTRDNLRNVSVERSSNQMLSSHATSTPSVGSRSCDEYTRTKRPDALMARGTISWAGVPTSGYARQPEERVAGTVTPASMSRTYVPESCWATSSATKTAWRPPLANFIAYTSNAPLLPGTRDTSCVTPVVRSCTNQSESSVVSPGAAFVARLTNSTRRPSALTCAAPLWPFSSPPSVRRLTRVVVPATRSRTNTSSTPFVSPGTTLAERDVNTTTEPSLEMPGESQTPFGWLLFPAPVSIWPPALVRLTRSVTCASRSRRYTSLEPFVSPATRSEAQLSNATKRPSPLTRARTELSSP